jgi:hypothetical protein
MPFKNIYHKLRVFKIKLMSWEYWPMWIVYFPVSFYYLYLSIRARSFFFFSAANPSIETGGMFFESKWKVLELIPKKYYPKTLFFDENEAPGKILGEMKNSGLGFPVIAKPDRGERGWCVKILHSTADLVEYSNKIKISFLIQEYINYPIELSVFYYRNPRNLRGNITSVTLKKLLSVKGNGYSSLDELIRQGDRSFIQMKSLINNKTIDFDRILDINEEQILVPYGNHVRGAMFLDYNHLINPELIDVFDKISRDIDGFYFGRFDLRCTSIEDFKIGKNISILELNGSGAEPAHIYQPGFSFFKAQEVLASHYRMMFDAAKENNRRGVEYMSFQMVRNTRNLEKIYKSRAGSL